MKALQLGVLFLFGDIMETKIRGKENI